METTLSNIIDSIQNFALSINPLFALIISFLLIVSESIIPILPLAAFITLNTLIFGNILGYIISAISTLIGCVLSFLFFRYVVKKHFYYKIQNKDNIINIMHKINNIKFSNLTMLLALPFTPAFAINIAAGLTGITLKKYFISLLISKPIMVYFWGFVGTSLIESISNPILFIKILLMLLTVYIVCLFINKKLEIE